MNGCQPADFVPAIKLPVIAFRPASEMERDSAKQQFALFQTHNFFTYIARNGVHGSSMLDPDRVVGDVEGTWKKVFDFLEQFISTGNHI